MAMAMKIIKKVMQKKTIKLNQLEIKLEKQHEKREWEAHTSGLDVLISTILSQNTSDSNSSRAFKSLKKVYPSWTKAARAHKASITKAIKSGGLAKVKAGYIKSALKRVKDDFGTYSLQKLKKKPIDESLEYLTSFDGVGEKTAACVLLFAFGKKVMPVDTHVHRVTHRLGLIKETADRQKSFQFWFGQNNIVDYYNLHLNMVRHGRLICKARNPKCDECALREACAYYNRRKRK
ncbi:MAG: endonuclease III [candidate division Zixibacteria bacterium]|nr:endonuclease III [candidate division Zixibacteria bacterium]